MIRWAAASARDGAARALRGEGLVCTAASGAEAARLCEEGEIDLLVVDPILRDLDGRGLVRRLMEMDIRVRPAVALLGGGQGEGIYSLPDPCGANDIYTLAAEITDDKGCVTPECRLPSPREGDVGRCLDEMGVPARLKGRGYMETALAYLLRDGRLSGNLKGRLYPAVAKKWGVTPGSVDRALRTAMENAFIRPRYDLFGGVAGEKTGLPTPGAFLSQAAEEIRLGWFAGDRRAADGERFEISQKFPKST